MSAGEIKPDDDDEDDNDEAECGSVDYGAVLTLALPSVWAISCLHTTH